MTKFYFSQILYLNLHAFKTKYKYAKIGSFFFFIKKNGEPMEKKQPSEAHKTVIPKIVHLLVFLCLFLRLLYNCNISHSILSLYYPISSLKLLFKFMVTTFPNCYCI